MKVVSSRSRLVQMYILRLPACSICDIFNPVLSVTSLILFYLWHLSWQGRQLPPRVKEIEIHIQWYFILAFTSIFASVNVHCTFTFANISINASMKYHFYLCCVRMASINACQGKFIIKTFRFVCFYPQSEVEFVHPVTARSSVKFLQAV